MARRWDEGVGVVTPEAVPLHFAEANVGSRAIALLIDWTILGLVLLLVNWFVGYLLDDSGGGFPEWVAIVVLLLANFTVFFGYSIAFETLTHGKTPGKAAMGLRVVTVEGAPVRFRHAAIRATMALVDFGFTLGMGAMFATLFSKRHQRFGDMVAGTVVLRERTATPAPRATYFRVPDGAEAYAESIDTSGLTVEEYETIREFLMRSFDLTPQTRADIGKQLAMGIATKLQHNPPPNVSAELFLRCVAARYQRRGAGPAPAAGVPQDRNAQPAPPARDEDQPAPPADSGPRWEDFAPPS